MSMKKLLSCFLCVVMILTTFSLTSCGGDKKVDTINGVDPEEALANALEMIEEADRHCINTDLKLEFGVGFLSASAECKNMHTSICDGNNRYIVTSSDNIEGTLFSDMLQEVVEELASESGYDELWYYEGIYFIRNGSQKLQERSWELVESKQSAILEQLFDEASDYTCYADYLGQYYIVFELTDESYYVSEDVDNIFFTIYFNKDGSIKRIIEKTDSGLFSAQSVNTYTYGNAVPEVVLPADASSYKSSSGKSIYDGFYSDK